MAQITTCNSREMLETAFGGMDYIPVNIEIPEQDNIDINNKYIFAPASSLTRKYGIITTNNIVKDRGRRPTGVATEIYNQILDTLTTQCMNLQGRFIEPQFTQVTNYDPENMCLSNFTENSRYYNLVETYKIGDAEDMCPRDYRLDVDTNSWGACICWENGGRRSKWGKSTKCTPSFATNYDDKKDKQCDNDDAIKPTTETTIDQWCTQNTNTDNQVLCPPDTTTTDCNDETYKDLPKGLDN
jgi:hypothetical protein